MICQRQYEASRRGRVWAVLLMAHAGMTAGCAAPATRPAAPIDWQRMDQVDHLIAQAIERGDIPGAVLLVGRSGRTVYAKAYGNRALLPQRIPMTIDTVFDLASLSKPVACATSIMLLAERGKLKLSDPVAAYIPGCPASPQAIIDGVVKLLGSLQEKKAVKAPEPAATAEKKDA